MVVGRGRKGVAQANLEVTVGRSQVPQHPSIPRNASFLKGEQEKELQACSPSSIHGHAENPGSFAYNQKKRSCIQG